MKKDVKRGQFVTLIVCILILSVTTGLGFVTRTFDSLEMVFESFHLDVQMVISLLVMVFFTLSITQLLIVIVGLFKVKTNRTKTIITTTQSLIRYASAIIIICWGLSIIGVDVSTIVASVGIVALVVGFGAESLIEDVVTGFFMLFENQYNVGDILEINGFRGTVTDIGIRTTSITDPGGNVKIINNSNMKDILNRSDNASMAVAEIDIPYETDIEDFEKKIPAMMNSIYELHKDIFKSEPTYLGVAELKDSGIALKFVAETDEANIFKAQRIMNRELLVFFRHAGVEVPYPQMDVHQK